MKKDSWWVIKNYCHIGDPPLYEWEKRALIKYIKTPSKIATHAFLPLIKRVKVEYRFRKNNSSLSASSKRIKSVKKRELCYASHCDSLIYRYYTYEILQKSYEHILQNDITLDKSVVAYRKLPRYRGNPNRGNRSNIDVAFEVFSFIKRKNKSGLFVGTYDITNFFNELDHKQLKEKWCEVCNFDALKLPPDHYNLYKNVCYYSYVNEKKLFNHFKNKIRCFRNKKSSEIVCRKVDKLKYMREKNAVSYCEKSKVGDLRKQGLICSNKYIHSKISQGKRIRRTKGIPQGLPISAVLANIYMLSFDRVMSKLLEGLGGLYKRYSDDIIVVCSAEHQDTVKSFMLENIKQLKLNIQEHKKKEFIVTKRNNSITCCDIFTERESPIQYLGFEFDGKNIALKSSSISKYYIKMHRSVRSSRYYSKRLRSQKFHGVIFKDRLFKRFSSYGKERKLKYRVCKGKKGVIVVGKSWGNYISYVHRASAIMRAPNIKRQLKRHMSILRRLTD